MTDRSKLLTQKERGERADRILNDPLVVEAFEAVRKDLLDTWENGYGGPGEREEAHRILCGMKLFREKLEIALRTGEAAGKELVRQADDNATEIT